MREPLTVDNNFKIALRGDGGEGCQIILTDSQDEDSVPSEPPNSFFLIPDYFANFQIFPDVNYVCKVFQYVTILQPSVFRKKITTSLCNILKNGLSCASVMIRV